MFQRLTSSLASAKRNPTLAKQTRSNYNYRSNSHSNNYYGRSFYSTQRSGGRGTYTGGRYAIGGLVALGGLALGFGLAVAQFMSNKDEDEENNQLVAYAAEAEPPAANLAQSTVVTGCHPHGGFVIIHLSPSANLKQVVSACAKLPQLVDQISGEEPKSGNALPALMAGVAFGTKTWENLVKGNKSLKQPENFSHFSAKTGSLGDMPETGGDLLLHVKGETKSMCWETVKQFVDSLPKGSVAKIDDQYGFQFQDGRDLSGFLDGTENPADPKSRRSAALLPTGGSYVIHQRWIHDLPKLHNQSVGEQEKIIGRSKPDSAEQRKLHAASHVARTRDAKGNKIPIVRQSMPFGTVAGPHGLLFIAYANNPAKFDVMLDRMVGKEGGPADATMSFSKCTASNYYYAPALKELVSLK